MPQFDLPLPELETYRPQVREPADFDEFWSATLAEARSFPLDLRMADAGASLALVDVQDVTFAGFGGQPIKAWLARPRGADAPLPCVVEVAGYGGGRGLPIEHTLWPAAGVATLWIDSRGQGSNWGSGGHTPDVGASGPASDGVMTRGIESPHDHYYRRLFTDAVRGVEAARSIDGIDPSQIFFAGTSQGGGVALAVAGLADGLAGVMADVPFLCHIERAIAITDERPYAEVVRYLSVHRGTRDRVLDTLSYLDGANHAKRATAPLLSSVALRDATCPPSTVYAAFNAYGSLASEAPTTEMVVYEDNEHEGGAGHQVARRLAFVRALTRES
ncbi:acetylxylan esterase [Demequina sp. NBRC 110055]|uniref:acetylxylan esterase n=1 Tax=Demequina sp. NBRC 110055 TaxID=1570344 RepID=UPI000A05B80C|nr:acetylxylan esterase [Demequina sp. NBRC 110055]